jgi:Arm DNA-binding domain
MGGKQPRISLGTYPAVSLQQARERAAECRALVANGIDPRKKRRDFVLVGVAGDYRDVSSSLVPVLVSMSNPLPTFETDRLLLRPRTMADFPRRKEIVQ